VGRRRGPAPPHRGQAAVEQAAGHGSVRRPGTTVRRPPIPAPWRRAAPGPAPAPSARSNPVRRGAFGSAASARPAVAPPRWGPPGSTRATRTRPRCKSCCAPTRPTGCGATPSPPGSTTPTTTARGASNRPAGCGRLTRSTLTLFFATRYAG
jgi:hypothetical protein